MQIKVAGIEGKDAKRQFLFYNLAYGRSYLPSDTSEPIKIMLGDGTSEETRLSVKFV